MHASFLRAQLSHDAQLPGYYFAPAETTPAEALRGRVRRAAIAGQKYLDSIEVEVVEHGDGDCVVRIHCWPVRWDRESRERFADALEAMAAEIRPVVK